jgi:hypothetical protein
MLHVSSSSVSRCEAVNHLQLTHGERKSATGAQAAMPLFSATAWKRTANRLLTVRQVSGNAAGPGFGRNWGRASNTSLVIPAKAGIQWQPIAGD